MDLGTLTLSTGTISAPSGGRKPSDNSIAEGWLKAAQDSGEAKAVTVPGTVTKNENGKTIYTGVANDVVNSLRRAAETYNKGVDEAEHIGVRFDVVKSGKDKVTVNFLTAPKIKRTRKTESVPEVVNPA